MEHIIQQICEGMLEEIVNTVQERGLNVAELMPKMVELTQRGAIQIVQELITVADDLLLKEKAERRRDGWVLERRGDSRSILTEIGTLSYDRNYYYNKQTKEYRYLIDQVVGVLPYMRVETSLSKQFVRKSRYESYQMTAEHSCGGQVSKQTVMNKIREAKPVFEIPLELKHVPEIHIDADEDHVAMQDKSYQCRALIPLVSVYEGVEQNGKRKRCKNIFHISSFKQAPDTIWEEVLTRVEQRYDLTDTKVYIHGDGASWIAKGKEWFPSAIFVLDIYHKNKYIKQMLTGYEEEKKVQLRKDINQALEDMDEDYFDNITRLLVEASPERKAKITDAAAYLHSHMPDIAIRVTDAAACNGGATEPHVSHVLSARLSSRPKGWSIKTLQSFVSILANGPNVTFEQSSSHTVQTVAANAMNKAKRQLLSHKSEARFQSSFVITQAGKCTELYKTLRGLAQSCAC